MRDLRQNLSRNARRNRGPVIRTGQTIPRTSVFIRQWLRLTILLVVHLDIDLFKLFLESLDQSIGFILSQFAGFHQPIGIDLANARTLANLLVHQGLREGWLVAFVVSVTTVTDHVNHNVHLKCLAELQSQFGHISHSLWIFAIHVKNRDFDHLGHVRAITRRTTVDRERGETDLVIHHHMNRSARLVTFKL